jgi:hypothetical protein
MPASLLEGTTMPTRGAEACVCIYACIVNQMYTKALHRPGTHCLLRFASLGGKRGGEGGGEGERGGGGGTRELEGEMRDKGGG